MKVKFDGCTIALTAIAFPGGERHVRLEELDDYFVGLDRFQDSANVDHVEVLMDFRGSDDIVDLMLVTDAIRRLPFINKNTIHTLIMPYMPFARQDRAAEVGEAHSAKVMGTVLNLLAYDNVVIGDAHSDVTGAVVNNVRLVSQAKLVNRHLGGEIVADGWVLCAPDTGATKKVDQLAQMLKVVDVVQGVKHRDTLTGKLTGFDCYGDVAGKKVMIVDDICDGGGTFLGLAQVLREKGATKVGLFVTHGIFSKGLEVFDGLIDQLYTVNVWSKNAVATPTNNLTVFKDKDFY